MPAGDAGLEQQTCEVCREIDRLRNQLAALGADLERITADAQHWSDVARAQQAVIDAARHAANSNAQIPGAPELSHIGTALIQELRAAIRALDKAQAAQPEGEQAS